MTAGTSPHMWGRQADRQLSLALNGNIPRVRGRHCYVTPRDVRAENSPTCEGQTRSLIAGRCSTAVDPHVRGADGYIDQFAGRGTGTSPRA